MTIRSYALLTIAAGLAGVPGKAELWFVPNAGQAQPEVRFMVKTPRLTAQFLQTQIWFSVKDVRIGYELLGANPAARIEGVGQLPGKTNFFLGSDPGGWQQDVPVYDEIRYTGIYPGVDMIYAGVKQRLKSDFIVAPGADASAIRFRYTGVNGLRVDTTGALVLATPAGTLREEAPEIYQQDGGGARRRVEGRYKVAADGSIGFALGAYDRARTLIIDPLIAYSTYFGGSGLDNVTGTAVDASGYVYITGWSDSQNLVTRNPLRSTPAGVEAFVAKFATDGRTLVYCTYIGGSGDDRASGIVVDAAGNVYIAGSTMSADFPVVNAAQTMLAGGKDAFVVKLSPAGNSLVYSTYYGGRANDSANAIAVNAAGNVFIAGETLSSDLPLYTPYQGTNHGLTDIFVAKLLPAGNGLVYSTYIGGRGDDRATAIAVNAAGAAYLTGSTTSPDFAMTMPFQSIFRGNQDAFVLKLDPSGSSLNYSTYLGGSGGGPGSPETGAGIAVDSAGNAYVAGTTGSFDFPLLNALQSTHSGSATDVFVTKLNSSGSGLVFSTYLGGSSIDVATAIALDSSGKIYVTGYTASTDFPSPTPTLAVNSGMYDGFMAQLAANGSQLLQSSLRGGGGSDTINAIALRGNEVSLAGQTASGNFPVQNALQPYAAGGLDGFVTKLAPSGWTFVPIVSCRVVDTRGAAGPLGGPLMSANTTRDFPILSGPCGIPVNARAYSLNVTALPRGFLGYISLWPTGNARPTVSTLNSYDGRVKSNAAVLPAGTGGSISLYTTNNTDLLVDINGYFVSPDEMPGMPFYPITPCRIMDTRNPQGTFGGPTLAAGSSRTVPVPSSACGLPATAAAYALNVTVVPHGALSFLTLWPTGAVMPVTSILAAPTGTVTANAAIVKAGTSGSLNMYAAENVDVIVDVNGYFGPAGTGGLSYYPVTPCRLLDTRNPAGSLGGPTLRGQRDFPLASSSCGVPASASAYSLNATVVPQATLGWLKLWPTGVTMPAVSTLNSLDGSLVANAAIVPVSNGWLSAYAVDATEFILDVNGYFAP